MTEAPPQSRIYTFIDEPRELALHFLEGQKLVHDLALLHDVRGQGFAYFRDVVLSVQPMIALIKREEQIGFYIDSEEPFFRLKIEANHQGDTRSALVPEAFAEFPATLRGSVRVQRIFPRNRSPYTSVLRIDGEPLGTIVNRVLEHSYQAPCAVLLSERSDQSVLLHQLPPIPGKDAYEYSAEAVRAKREALRAVLEPIFARALHRPEQIDEAFAGIGFRRIAERPLEFRCNCSRERMIENLKRIANVDVEELFDPGKSTLEVRCEYCKTRYEISRADLVGPGGYVH